MGSFRSKAGKALFWDLTGNYAGQVTAFIISVFLARLLGPEEFGMVGMSMVFISILKVFMDFGFASALIQNKNNTSVTYSSVFYLNIFAGAFLTAVIYAASPLIGRFYESDTITVLVKLLSITFFVSSFNVVQSTILRKNLNFRYLTYRNLLSQVISGVIAVAFAWRGFGVYSLVLQQVVASMINTALLWRVTDWYPKLEFSWAEVKKLTGFSSYLFASQSINQTVRQADILMIGTLFSPVTLGFFSRANSLNSLINKNTVSSLSKVFFPALSAINNDDEKFKDVYLKLISLIASISFLFTGLLFLTGGELIVGLFGEKWKPAVPIFQILIIKGFTYPISAMIVNAFLAKGKSKENFYYGNITRALQLSPFVVAYFYGFFPYLYSLVVVSILAWLLSNYFVCRVLSISWRDQIKAVVPGLLIAGMLVLFIEVYFPQEWDYAGAIAKGGVFTFCFICGLWAMNHHLISEFKHYYSVLKVRVKQI